MNKEWKPYCYEEKCHQKHEKIRPSHGRCCTCQECGHGYDECVCQFFEEPCLSCIFKES